jgi:tetratricopeptide (TPR) repeat protein
MQLIQRALALDPEYGLAWAGAADGYTLFGYYGVRSPEECSKQARHAADRAMQLAPNLAEAHAARAMVSLLFDWDFVAAEQHFMRCMELNPAYVQGASWYHLFHSGFLRGSWEATFAGMRKLEELEPLSGYLAGAMGVGFSAGGECQEALRMADKAMQLAPDAFLSLWSRQLALYACGEFEQAVAASDELLALSGRHQLAFPTLAAAHVELGQMTQAKSVYREMLARKERDHIAPTIVAIVAAAVGEHAAAADFSREAFTRRDPQLPIYCGTWRQTRFLAALPEFNAILAEMNVPTLERRA